MNTETKFAVATFSHFTGVQVAIGAGCAADYLCMKANQLAALSRIICDGQFDGWDESTKTNLRWLASSLADEICCLVPISLEETKTLS